MSIDVHTLSGAYALDALTPEEAAAFEAHLEGCAACRDEVREFREVVAAMGEQSWAAAPRGLRDSVLTVASQTPQQRPPARMPDSDELATRRRRTPALLLAAAVAVIAAAVGGVVVLGGPKDDVQQVALDAPAREVFNASDASQVAVTTSNGGTLHVAVSPSRAEMAVDVRDLPQLDDEHVYQLWTVRDGLMRSRAILGGDTAGAAMGIPESGTEVAITVEPGRGSAQPTTDPIATVDPASI
jgi:anti-sigma factor RsiW